MNTYTTQPYILNAALEATVSIQVKCGCVKAQDISSVLRVADALSSSRESALHNRGRVSLTFDGYERDQREIWEIPEIRSFVKKLHAEWPSWMFFISNSNYSFTALFQCLVKVRRTNDPNKSQLLELPPEILVQGFEGINLICDEYQLGDEVCNNESHRIMSALGLKRE
jgi:hypothetical protein